MKKIIIIDNESILRPIFEEIFENKYNLIFTYCIADTIVSILNNKKDIALIITEFNIKYRENGIELIENLKAYGMGNIPVLIYSAIEEHKNIVSAFNGHFFRLPADFRQVMKMVMEIAGT